MSISCIISSLFIYLPSNNYLSVSIYLRPSLSQHQLTTFIYVRLLFHLQLFTFVYFSIYNCLRLSTFPSTIVYVCLLFHLQLFTFVYFSIYNCLCLSTFPPTIVYVCLLFHQQLPVYFSYMSSFVYLFNQQLYSSYAGILKIILSLQKSFLSKDFSFPLLGLKISLEWKEKFTC